MDLYTRFILIERKYSTTPKRFPTSADGRRKRRGGRDGQDGAERVAYLAQIGTCSTIVSFRVGPDDASF
jgi:hypothetical protein